MFPCSDVLDAVDGAVAVASILLFVVAFPLLTVAEARRWKGKILHRIVAESLKVGIAGVVVVGHVINPKP
jgi:hypothetical protein